MPNIASIMKEEILRLARKEVRSETEGIKKASAQYRSEIAGLKRRLAALERQLSHVEKRASRKTGTQEADAAPTRIRFSAKGFAKHRQRMGFTAADMGVLLNVSAQTIYNWEAGKSKPRQAQLAAIAALREVGKREAKARLIALRPK
ncbi:MAG: helix-turn-helix domain-containing protein [Geothrix sp.]|nr:helix-turn-helix domain-containing protein [Geothrix sp.]